jgi:hypothetical protein
LTESSWPPLPFSMGPAAPRGSVRTGVAFCRRRAGNLALHRPGCDRESLSLVRVESAPNGDRIGGGPAAAAATLVVAGRRAV